MVGTSVPTVAHKWMVIPMYDELIKRLRECTAEQNGEKTLWYQAADAIEELTAINERQLLEIAVLSKPRWIPVTERLPESGVHVLACCRVKWLGGGGRNYVCDAFYSAPKAVICSYNDDIEAEYDEDTDEYYMPEGWWEVIKNWDDYSCVAIADFVTHWMPLPEPPKEET